MGNQVCKMIPPSGIRKHTFCSVERDGMRLWVDLTELRKARSIDGVSLYRLEGESLIHDRYERVALLHEHGIY